MTENDPHAKFGETITGSRWFNADPELTQVEMVPVRHRRHREDRRELAMIMKMAVEFIERDTG